MMPVLGSFPYTGRYGKQYKRGALAPLAVVHHILFILDPKFCKDR